MQLIAIIHSCICVYLTFLLCEQPGDWIQTEVCLCTVCWLLKEKCGKYFFMEESTGFAKENRGDGLVRVLPEFLDFYQLLFSVMFPFSNQQRLIWCNRFDL